LITISIKVNNVPDCRIAVRQGTYNEEAASDPQVELLGLARWLGFGQLRYRWLRPEEIWVRPVFSRLLRV
jgi:hypothetical protein